MEIRGTTIVGIRKNGQTAIAGDGQVTMGEHTIMKSGAKKVRRLYHNKVAAGFAGSVADAFTLCEKFEARLEECRGNLEKAAVGLAKEWRTDKYLRNLEALLIVADSEKMLIISGNGEVTELFDYPAACGIAFCFEAVLIDSHKLQEVSDWKIAVDFELVLVLYHDVRIDFIGFVVDFSDNLLKNIFH